VFNGSCTFGLYLGAHTLDKIVDVLVGELRHRVFDNELAREEMQADLQERRGVFLRQYLDCNRARLLELGQIGVKILALQLYASRAVLTGRIAHRGRVCC
jgi:hypothetical protein